jgi:hypothetical protein
MKTNTYLEPYVYTICDVYNYFIFQNPLSSWKKTLYKIFSLVLCQKIYMPPSVYIPILHYCGWVVW